MCRCPLKKQNYDYIMYCLTALFFESWRVEPWEIYQTREDLLEYLWEDSSSMHRIVEVVKARRAATEKPAPDSYLARLSPETTPEEVLKLPEVQQYGKTFSTMVKEPFNYDAIEKYKETVLSLYELNQKPEPIEPQVSK
ncbi:MRPS35 [Cordylochernes scorpioides]|uniref:MRPS35 n=1 Tax=Cordylochernes scorpioides TaxID=51811 RepID=A0ABY6L7S1_9ARAC|nr:MRPS35 [Cordylochernes scorpioides]